MSISKTDLITKSELNLDRKHNQDINQLICCLKNAIFFKYISNYLIEKTEEMWILYSKRIDKYLKENNLDITCDHIRPQTIIQLEELAKHQQENIVRCKRDIENLCSSRKRLRNDNYSNHVPKTPRCIDRIAPESMSIYSKT